MSTTARRTIANTVDLSMRVLKHKYEDIVAYGENAANDLLIAYNTYNQIMNMYKLFRKVPAYSDEPGAAALNYAVDEGVHKNTQMIDNILLRFYGIQYFFSIRTNNRMFGWYHVTSDSLIPHDQQPELIRNLPIAYTEHEQEDND